LTSKMKLSGYLRKLLDGDGAPKAASVIFTTEAQRGEAATKR